MQCRLGTPRPLHYLGIPWHCGMVLYSNPRRKLGEYAEQVNNRKLCSYGSLTRNETPGRGRSPSSPPLPFPLLSPFLHCKFHLAERNFSQARDLHSYSPADHRGRRPCSRLFSPSLTIRQTASIRSFVRSWEYDMLSLSLSLSRPLS